MLVLEPLPECVRELDRLLDSSDENVVKSTSKLLLKWDDRVEKGFGIEGPGRLRTLAGPNGTEVTVKEYKFPEDYVAAVVAIDEDEKFGRILIARESNNQQQFNDIYRIAISRLRDWIRKHGSLQ